MHPRPFPTISRDTRVTVMGLGTFGGGAGAVRFLAGRGAQVTVTDLCDADSLANARATLADLPAIRWRLGEHREEDFTEADLVVVNPAVPPGSRWLEIARESGAELTSEISLFWQLNPAGTIAVTGSNGKSTTTAMIHAILEARDTAAAGRAWRGGNIGGSLLGELEQITARDLVVLELSSFQLEHLDRLQAAPDVAVVTNLAPNHLDRHGTMQAYRHAKQSILRWQTAKQTAVLNADDDDVFAWPTAARRLGFGRQPGPGPGVFLDGDTAVVRVGAETHELPLGRWIGLPGRHNLHNAAAATAAALVAGAGLDDVRRGLLGFAGLPHRLELVVEVAGRRFYNDSLATTPESVAVALESFARPVVLLAGGYDKRVPLEGLAETIAGGVKAVALMGQTAGALEGLLSACSDPPTRMMCGSLEEAFAWAVARSDPGDTVLLSPGCASYDWFTSFRERGDEFARLARRLRRAA